MKARQLFAALQKIDSGFSEHPEPVEAAPIRELKTTSFCTAPRILIAEDNLLNLSLLQEMIKQQIPQAHIFVAEDGILAIEATKVHQPHLILMDVQMPNLDGIRATQQIRKFSDLPVIAITAGALSEERDKCMAAGMDDFLTKPVLAIELYETMIKHLCKTLTLCGSPNQENTLQTFNHKALLDNLSQDEETFFSLLQIVHNSIPAKLEQLKEAIDAKDSREVLGILHSIRGSAQNMYFKSLAEAIAKLEKSYMQISLAEAIAKYDTIMLAWQDLLAIITDFRLN